MSSIFFDKSLGPFFKIDCIHIRNHPYAYIRSSLSWAPIVINSRILAYLTSLYYFGHLRGIMQNLSPPSSSYSAMEGPLGFAWFWLYRNFPLKMSKKIYDRLHILTLVTSRFAFSLRSLRALRSGSQQLPGKLGCQARQLVWFGEIQLDESFLALFVKHRHPDWSLKPEPLTLFKFFGFSVFFSSLTILWYKS